MSSKIDVVPAAPSLIFRINDPQEKRKNIKGPGFVSLNSFWVLSVRQAPINMGPYGVQLGFLLKHISGFSI